MATLSQTVAKLGRLVEAEVTLPTATGTVNSVTIPANSVVLSAGAVVTQAVTGSTAHTFNLDLGGTDIATALDVFAASLGDILVEASTPVATTSEASIVVDSTVTGAGTAGKVRVWALVLDMTAPIAADEVDRDQLA
jgi:hypothetical protein